MKTSASKHTTGTNFRHSMRGRSKHSGFNIDEGSEPLSQEIKHRNVAHIVWVASLLMAPWQRLGVLPKTGMQRRAIGEL